MNGLGRYHPIKPGATILPRPGGDPRALSANIGGAGSVPSVATLTSAIEAAYSDLSITPVIGDIVYMQQFHFLIMPDIRANGGVSITANDIFRIKITVGGTPYTAFQIGPNRLF